MFTVSLITHGHGVMSANLVNQLLNFPYIDKIIVTFNIPEDLLLPYHDKIVVINNAIPKGFGANHNAAFKLSDSPWFVILNPDVIFNDDIFSKFYRSYSKSKYGIYAPLATDNRSKQEDNWRKFPSLFRLLLKLFGFDRSVYFLDSIKSDVDCIDWASGLLLIFPAKLYELLEGFNERFFMYYEDVDICYRAWQINIPVFACKNLVVIHNARRDSRKNIRHLLIHLKSAFRYFFFNFK
jgi:GT2 family glycosyltransferase